ncbi:MAG: Glycosyltransferase [Microgenomates group bacterium GW2011_GWB1_45_17]|nr:MAG: Glycosyltransferase [Microgenomates group bacterium GW2011_GWB1_45_17]
MHLAGNPLLHATPKTDVDAVLKKYNIPEKYLLYVGDINYNKNLPALLRAFSTLSQNLHLVMVGRSLNNIEIPEGRWIHDTIQEKGIAQRVHLLTDIPKHPATELAALFTGASAYVQPSLYEGFGLSVLDAMQCGALVISSTGGFLIPEMNMKWQIR